MILFLAVMQLFSTILSLFIFSTFISIIKPYLSLFYIITFLPIIYFMWLFLFLLISHIEIRIFCFFSKGKPKLVIVDGKNKIPLSFIYSLFTYMKRKYIQSLPGIALLMSSPAAKLVLKAYAPYLNIGEKTNITFLIGDPELTEIGKNVVYGVGAYIAAHAITNKSENGKIKYVFATAKVVIGNNVTIGSHSIIGLGAFIGDYSIIEMGSIVTPYTYIPENEVWGGNPAIFIRKNNRIKHPIIRNENKLKDIIPNIGKDEIHKKIIQIIADTLNLSLDKDQTIDEILYSELDSLSKIAIAERLFEYFQIRLTPEEIWRLSSVEDIVSIIILKQNNQSPL